MNHQLFTFEDESERLLQIFANRDISESQERLRIKATADSSMIPFFGKAYQASSQGVRDHHDCSVDPAVSVVLLTYCVYSPAIFRESCNWISYRELDGAGPLMGYFNENTGKTLVKAFAGKLGELKKAGSNLAGKIIPHTAAFDLVMEFEALPRIPIQIRFNDAEENFPASCQVLFQENAQNYLDIKSLSVIGTFLCGSLIAYLK